MLKDLNFKGIVQFFKDIPEGQMGDIKRAQIYSLALEGQKRRVKEEAIESIIKGNSRKSVENVTIISDDISIVETIETWNGKNEHCFRPVVKGRATMEITDSFDYALIIAIATKYNEGNHAPRMISNMLRMDNLEEQEISENSSAFK